MIHVPGNVDGEEVMEIMESVLTSIKKMLGITEEYEHFDSDIIMHINSVFMILTQLGVGPPSGFSIRDNRRELYTDARDVSSTVDNETLTDSEYKAQLSQRGLENLSENIATKSFEGKVETTRMYRYGEDFFLGDMVQIVNEYGIEGKARVTEFIRSQSKEGLDSYPTFVTVE